MALSRVPKSFLLHRKKLLRRQSTLLEFVGLLLSSLFYHQSRVLGTRERTYLQLLLVFASNLHDVLDIVSETELLQRFGDVFARNSLLALLFANLICFRGNQSDKLDTTFDEQIPRIFAKSKTRGWGENFRDDLLNGGYKHDY